MACKFAASPPVPSCLCASTSADLVTDKSAKLMMQRRSFPGTFSRPCCRAGDAGVAWIESIDGVMQDSASRTMPNRAFQTLPSRRAWPVDAASKFANPFPMSYSIIHLGLKAPLSALFRPLHRCTAAPLHRSKTQSPPILPPKCQTLTCCLIYSSSILREHLNI